MKYASPFHVFRLILFVILVLTVTGSACFASDQILKVKWVADGDTLQLRSGEWVRLQGIDTPETGKKGKLGQYYAEKAKALLQSMVKGGVVLKRHGKDRYRRTLAEVFTPDGRNINMMLLRQGAAFYYWHKGHSVKMRTRMVKVQNEAIQAGRGFWPRLKKLPAWTRKWVGNKNSGRAFPAGSREAKRLAVRNRVYLDSLADVFAGGFSPARHLSPWPQE